MQNQLVRYATEAGWTYLSREVVRRTGSVPAEHGLLDDVCYWKLAQTLSEVLPHDTEDWKLISALLGKREMFKSEAKTGQRPAIFSSSR